MARWSEIAGILAKEASYRAQRRAGAERSRLIKLVGGGLVRSNLLGALLFTGMSLFFCIGAVFDQRFIVPMMGVLGLVELLVGAFATASTVHVILTEGLLEPLSTLPVTESDIRLALLSVGVYWGGLSMVFAVIPGALLIAAKRGMWTVALWGALEAVALLLLAFGVGYLLGSLSPKYTRSRISRALQTVAWLLFFGFGLLFQLLPHQAAGFVGEAGVPGWLLLVPPFSFPAAALGVREAIASSLAFAALSSVILRVGAGRLWRAASSGRFALPTSAPTEKWVITAGRLQPLKKDLRLLGMNPRMLASTVYYAVIGPAIVIAPMLADVMTGDSGISRFLPAIGLFFGGVGGAGVYYLYALDAEGARLLYHLPLTRGEVARQKAVTLAATVSPIVLIVGVVGALSGGMLAGLAAVVTYGLTLLGSAMLNSAILAKRLPGEPSAWTQETFTKGTLGLLMLAEFVVFGAAAAAAVVPAMLFGGVGSDLLSTALALIESIFTLYLGWKWTRGLRDPL